MDLMARMELGGETGYFSASYVLEEKEDVCIVPFFVPVRSIEDKATKKDIMSRTTRRAHCR